MTSWAVQGTDPCALCGQLYAFELERYCVECDLPGCPFCVTLVSGGPTCLDCTAEPQEGR